jgi:hypothetical protein
MNIEIHDSAIEARIQRQIRATGAASAEEALLRLLETQEEQDRWLLENKNAINAKIRRGIDQLVPFEHAGNGFFYYLRGVLAFAGGKVL